jgi:endonuclease YncB( thermonuclease family)
MKPINIKRILGAIGISILLSLTSGCATKYTVEKIVDGDTIVLTNGEKIRLLQIDPPSAMGKKRL